MKLTSVTRVSSLIATATGLVGLGLLPARADTIYLNATQPIGADWNQAAYWGSPPAAPTAGNDYVVPSGLTLRTPSNLAPAPFAGDRLIVRGTLALKHGNSPAVANVVLDGGQINHSQGPTGTTNTPFAGTLVVSNNSTLNTSSGAGIRDILLQSVLTGTANLAVSSSTNTLHVDCDASGYSGNWNISGRVVVYRGGSNPLGFGAINLSGASSRLTFRSATDIELAQTFSGIGALTQTGPGKLHFPDLSGFSGALTVNGGYLLLDGVSYQSATTVAGDGILRVTSGAALGSGVPLSVTPNNAQTGRLELANNVTVQTTSPIAASMRNNPTVAILSVSGDNVVADTLTIQTGGGQLRFEAAAGASLELRGGVSSAATGGRNFTLQGAGTGIVSGPVDNGSASAVTVNKDGTGTWTLAGLNTYTGNTVVSNGVLRIGSGATVGTCPIFEVNAGGVLDVSASTFTLTAQTLRGNGAVAGNLTTDGAAMLEVGFAGQYGPLSFSNSLTLGANALIYFDLSSATNDVLHVGGNLTLTGPVTNVINLPLGELANGTYRLINYGGNLTGGGNFALAAPGRRQIMTLDFSTPHQVNLVVTGNPAALVWSGDGLLNLWDVGASKNWNNQSEFFYNGDTVTFNDSGSATPEINIVSTVSPGVMVVSNEIKAFTFAGTNITTLGPLTKQGAGTVMLASDGNNIQGQITIAGGTLQIGTNGLTGSLGTGNILNNGALVLDKLDTSGATLSGNISGSGSITVRGGGSLNLRGTNNSYTGATVVEAGNLDIASNQALGDTNTGTTVLAGGRVGITTLGTWTLAEPLTLNGDGLAAYPGALYVNQATNNVTWLGPITLASSSRIRAVNNEIRLTLANRVVGENQGLLVSAEGNANSTVTFLDTLNLGTGELAKDGVGTAVLGGMTNIAGSTVVNAGTLAIRTTNAPTIGVVTVNGGALQIGDGGPNGSFPVDLVNLAGASSSLRFNTARDVALDREVFGQGGLAKLNTNTLVIGISNSFAGAVTTGSGTPTTGGIIRLLNSFGLGDGSAPKNVSIIRTELRLEGGLNIPAGISFQTSGGSFVTDVGIGLIPIRSVSGNNVIQGTVSLIGGAGDSEFSVDSGTLTIIGAVSPNYSSTRGLRLSGAGTGFLNGGLSDGNTTASLTKQGSGRWTLGAPSGYSGATTISGGTLALGAAATLASTPTITLQSNAVFDVSALSGGFEVGAAQTLKGDGTIVGKVTVTGLVSPGQSVGVLNFTDALSLNGTAILEVNRTGAVLSADLISAKSILFGGTLTVTNTGAELQGGEVFTLFRGTLSGAFSSINLPVLSNPDLSWNTDSLATQGIIWVQGGAAPPTTLLPPTLNGGNLVIQCQSLPGYKYVLEATSALVPAVWTPLMTNAGGGLITFPVPIDPLKPAQFFRVSSGN